MQSFVKKLFKIFVICATFVLPLGAIADQAPNPRAATLENTARIRVTDVRDGARTATSGNVTSRNVSRAATTNNSRSATHNVVVRSANRQNVVNTGTAVSARSAVRSATTSRAATSSVVRPNVRSATPISTVNKARATAVFSDISKIGSGYAACRDAYATCMDQFCAVANDTYRRCFCSSKFEEFRNTEDALDQAKTLLMQFEDNNLNAVDKTAAEVNAMYSATAGEMAIKKDTSGAQEMLDEIGDLLSGKKKSSSSNNSSTSLGILNFDFSADIDDIWNSDSDGIFSTSGGVDLTSLQGQELFENANKQCLQMIKESCENNAVLTMARSAYGIMITQDCNTYEKKVENERQAVKDTVRTAEKYLREARLEEYQSHNSADVNECITKVRAAITNDVACGANYKKCLDMGTGAYIDPNTGDANYSPMLYKLEELIKMDGTSDLLSQNNQYNTYLDSKRQFAKTALDTCRDISETVWTEFKRAAIIEIAQAQSAKLEEIKMTCISTMAECYDSQSQQLKDFDTNTAKYSGAISAYAAKAMCADKVVACAALYGDKEEHVACTFDDYGRFTGDAKKCGLTALLAFVENVDSTRVAEGCATAIDSYLQNLCTPTSGTDGYPWQCRGKKIGDIFGTSATGGTINDSLSDNVRWFALNNCNDPANPVDNFADLPLETQLNVQNALSNISEEMEGLLMDQCENLDGYWVEELDTGDKKLNVFYANLYNGQTPETGLGYCIENTTMVQCLNYNDDIDTESGRTLASYDRTTDECTFTDEWYQEKCSILGGYFESGVCYVSNK